MPGDLIPPASPVIFIENTDPNSNFSDNSVYWTPGSNSNSNVGAYYNVNTPTNEIFSDIQFSGSVSSITSYTVSVQYGSLLFNNSAVPGNAYTGALSGSVSAITLPAGLQYVPSGGLMDTVTITVYTNNSPNAALQVSYPINMYCFVQGTLISCPDGVRPIEALKSGDLVLNSQGIAREIRFVGQRTLNLSDAPEHAPILIPAGAIADGVPSRDLRLSPDHAVVMEGVLIPVRALIGEVVVQEAAEQVNYFHIQLDSHDIVLAESTPCETLLNTDDPSIFDNANEAVISDAFLAPCLPRVTQGPAVEAARHHLRARRLVTA